MDGRNARPPASAKFLARMVPGQGIPAGTPMKAGGVQSFAQRRQIENNRQIVRSYNQSRLGASPKLNDVRRMGVEITAVSPRSNPSRPNAVRPQASFSEPEGRHYVPYG